MKTSKIINIINKMTTDQLIELNNRYCQSICSEGEIYENDEEFFNLFFPNAGDGLRVAQAVFYGDYNYSHNYVKFNGYGNLESLDYFEVNDLCELVSTMAEYIAENFEEFNDLFE